ncbi:MAG TPA: AMP-binding protein [Candidatus Acidoferrales bacterium]|nr:AMP-binding protein [Candidatus Acidoferrales bacterium]
MLDLNKYNCLGEALRTALDRWPDETCLIESDRERDNCRLTYRQFKEAALPLAAALQDAGLSSGVRVAILMSNQSRWLISAYAVFSCGGVLVPLDYKLPADDQLKLLAHSKAEFLITEYHLWRAITKGEEFGDLSARTVLVTEAPANADLTGAQRWEEFRAAREPSFVVRERKDAACIVYSSGTGGRPKGCVLTHENYLEQATAVAPIFPFWPGARYLSIIPTNHAIDFMGGFIMPFTGGGAVVHLRTLRPEYIRDAFTRYGITYMAVVPLILKSLQRGLTEKFTALPSFKRRMLNLLIATNRALTKGKPRPSLSRKLLKDIHAGFGGGLRALLVGGAFTEPATIEFFHDLGIPIYNGYGCTEACTAITVNDQRPFRPETVGRPVRGMELRILNPGEGSVGEVAVRSKTVMSHYLDDPEQTAETIVDGWLITGDLGRLDDSGQLQLFGRKKNMIVTEEGKNIYPEDIEAVFDGLRVKESCVFAANFLWTARTMVGEQLVLVIHPEAGKQMNAALSEEIAQRNRRLANYKRVGGYLVWERDFPLTASLKCKRGELASQIREAVGRESVVPL